MLSTPQAIVTFVMFVLAFTMMLASTFLIPSPSGAMGKFFAVLIVFATIPLFLLQTYTVNCMVVGDCNIWTWVVTTIIVIVTLMYIITAIMSIIKHRKSCNEPSAESTTPTSTSSSASSPPPVVSKATTPATSATTTTSATSSINVKP